MKSIVATPSYPVRLLLILVIGVGLGLASCVPVTETADPDASVVIDFNNPDQRRIYDLQDQHEVDSLISYLESPDVDLRHLAARAFGSVMADSAIAPLTRLLLDPVDKIRAAAAYALGQQGDSRAQAALLQAFDFRDTAGVYATSNAMILEALGKIGDTTMLEGFASVTTYLPTDTLLLLGQARGIYRAALRGQTRPLATKMMLERALEDQWPDEVRLIAAHYLQRSKIDLTGRGRQILSAWSSITNPQLRAPLARALGKDLTPTVTQGLLRIYADEKDPLVRVELLRALGKHPYELTLQALLAATADEQHLVAQTAATQILASGIAEDATRYWQLAKDTTTHHATRPILYAAALRHMPVYLRDYRRYINAELRRGFAASTDSYERANVLRVLAEAPWNYRFLIEQARTNNNLVEVTAAAEALQAIVNRPDVVAYFGGSFPTVKREFGAYLQEAFSTNNPGHMAVAAQILAQPAWNFETEFESLDFLEQAKRKLKLPRETETYYFIEEAQQALNPSHEAQKPLPRYNHEINWDIYRSLQPGLEVAIDTDKGLIVLDLFEKDAPGTVVNFVQLVRNGFYNGKRFHRIVPAFVTQGGGPRGDGYGSLDFTIRSETPERYYDGPGYVGMASAGRDTEGVQFFFTHQATPHLDGRYTIFGKVIAGMDVVMELEQGDEMRMQLR